MTLRSLIVMLAFFWPTLAATADEARPMSAHDFSFQSIDGEALSLAQFTGKPVLVVNTASRCGFTRQYADLQSLWARCLLLPVLSTTSTRPPQAEWSGA